MSVQMLRFRNSPEHSAAVRESVAALVAAVGDAAPGAFRYVALEETAEPVFTVILELLDQAVNPLRSTPAVVAFRGRLPQWTDNDLTPRPCAVLGRYAAR